jgi:23S rRNA (adenine2030-N6)-methyltransferase
MNYRHAFHAGNFADVHKHAVLARLLMHLRAKPAPFRAIDTHAGAGIYSLAGPEAERTGEWKDGIARLLDTALDPHAAELFGPYIDAVKASNPPQQLVVYPGSPALVRSMLRRDDRLIACELEPGAAGALAEAVGRDARVKTIAIDGWTALSAYIPPKERRGLVMVDPPFEHPEEFSRLGDAVVRACRKWPTGIFMLWYPIKDRVGPDTLARALRTSGIPKILRAELEVAPPGHDPARLRGSGLILINPPYRLQDELSIMQPTLAAALGRAVAGHTRTEWIACEK